MLHLTLDSMKVQPDDITILIKKGEQVVQGQKIAILHRKKLQQRKLDDTVITILLNSSDYHSVTLDSNKLIAKV